MERWQVVGKSTLACLVVLSTGYHRFTLSMRRSSHTLVVYEVLGDWQV